MKPIKPEKPKSGLKSIIEGIILLLIPLLIGYILYLLAS